MVLAGIKLERWGSQTALVPAYGPPAHPNSPATAKLLALLYPLYPLNPPQASLAGPAICLS